MYLPTYDNVRSRKVIDLVYNMVFGCYYNDLRSMMTALAEILKKTCICTTHENGLNHTHASIDNFDLNER